MSDCHIISHYPSDTLGMSIEYRSANLYNTYIMYNPADIRWHVLIDIMSQYYPCYYRIFGLNGVNWPIESPASTLPSSPPSLPTPPSMPLLLPPASEAPYFT